MPGGAVASSESGVVYSDVLLFTLLFTSEKHDIATSDKVTCCGEKQSVHYREMSCDYHPLWWLLSAHYFADSGKMVESVH